MFAPVSNDVDVGVYPNLNVVKVGVTGHNSLGVLGQLIFEKLSETAVTFNNS